MNERSHTVIAMPRVLWKGAISFGLVHVPVSLYAATARDGLDFDWLDRRTMDPVGYRRINKKTGEEVSKDDIVRGIQYERGQYVVLSDEEIASANPRSTQTIDIQNFVEGDAVPPQYFENAYYLAPVQRGQKVYTLLREALARTGTIGIATVVLWRKQHLAAVQPLGDHLMLHTLRWSNEVKPVTEIGIAEEDLDASALKEKELGMAEQLIADMTEAWDPTRYRDTFRDDVLALVERKAGAGEIEQVTVDSGEEPAPFTANVIDLTDLLRRSLKGETRSAPRKKPARAAPAGKKRATSRPASRSRRG